MEKTSLEPMSFATLEYILMGDINIWHESMGAPARQRYSMAFKYILGDLVMKHMTQIGMINIHNGDVTMIKTIQGQRKEFHVDGIWATNNLIHQTQINTKFNHQYTCSDHYPGIITLKAMMHINRKKQSTQIMKHWQLNEMNDESWQIFQDKVDHKMKQIQQQTQQNMHHPMFSKALSQ